MLPSNLGHQKWLRAKAFMRVMPKCPHSCNSWRMQLRSWLGITTLLPHNKQFCSKDSSNLRVKYGCNCGSVHFSGHPYAVYSIARAITSSLLDADATSFALIGKSLATLTSNSCPSMCKKSFESGGNGKRERASAFPWSNVFRYSMSYWCAWRMTAQRWSRCAANVGMPCFGPKIVTRGLWSVTKVNCRPYT